MSKATSRFPTAEAVFGLFWVVVAILTWATGPAVDRFLSSDYNKDIPSIETLKVVWDLGHSALATLFSAIAAYLLSRERFKSKVIEAEFQRQRESAASSARRLYKLQRQLEEMDDSLEEWRLHFTLPAPATRGIVRHLKAMRQEVLSQMDDLRRIIQDRKNPLLLPDFQETAGCPNTDCEGELKFSRLSPYPGETRHARCPDCKTNFRGTRTETGSILAQLPERKNRREDRIVCPTASCGQDLYIDFQSEGMRRTACIHCEMTFEVDAGSKGLKPLGKQVVVIEQKDLVRQRGLHRVVCPKDKTILSPQSFRLNKAGVLGSVCFSCGSVFLDSKRLIQITEPAPPANT